MEGTESRGINVKKESSEFFGFDKKWNDAHPGRRDRVNSIGMVMERWAKFISDDSVQVAMDYKPKPGDMFIATHSKAGTTMMQQIVHQLRSKGDESFEEISVVVPWLEMAGDVGIDLDAEQTFRPHAFKTHFDWPNVPKTYDENVSLDNSIFFFIGGCG